MILKVKGKVHQVIFFDNFGVVVSCTFDHRFYILNKLCVKEIFIDMNIDKKNERIINNINKASIKT